MAALLPVGNCGYKFDVHGAMQGGYARLYFYFCAFISMAVFIIQSLCFVVLCFDLVWLFLRTFRATGMTVYRMFPVLISCTVTLSE